MDKKLIVEVLDEAGCLHAAERVESIPDELVAVVDKITKAVAPNMDNGERYLHVMALCLRLNGRAHGKPGKSRNRDA